MRNEEISGVGPREGGWSQPGGCRKRTEAEQATGIGWSASVERTERPASRVWVGRRRRRSKPAVAEEMAGVVAGGSRVRARDADGDAGRSRGTGAPASGGGRGRPVVLVGRRRRRSRLPAAKETAGEPVAAGYARVLWRSAWARQRRERRWWRAAGGGAGGGSGGLLW
jgi:hypothetical protein